MNRLTKTTLVLSLASLGMASIANAQDDAVHEAGLTLNSYGLGVFYGYQINDQLTIRTQISGIDADEADASFSDLDYEGDAEAGALGLGLDWRPFSDGWAKKVYFSGGLMQVEADFNGDAKAKIGDTINVGGASVGSGSIDGLNVDIDYDQQITPYLGVGWRTKAAGEKGLAFTTELGMINMDDPSVTLTADDPDGVLSQANLDDERDQIVDDLGGVSGYVSFGASYRF